MRSLALFALALFACAEQAEPGVATLTPRATLVLEPASLSVGDVAAVELAVVTPPGHRVRPFAPPAEIPGFWILDAEALETAREPTHWIHRTRVRVRAREVGVFRFPAGRVEVEAPDGAGSPLAYEALALEVASVLPEHPDRLQPFGAIAPPRAASGGAALAWAAAGSLLTLSCVGLVLLARRRARLRAEAHAAVVPAAEPPWRETQRALEAARALTAEDLVAAADATSACLRRYADVRFGAESAARTTEELERSAPPFLATTRWPVFVSLLRRLDDLRFPPRATEPEVRREILSLIADVEAFVESSISREERT